MENKRKREPNFTVEEKALLAKLVNDRKSIIESKATDGKTVARKKVAWEAITQEFNSNLDVCKRATITLKRAWDNLKAMTRKARAIERGNLIQTGDPLHPQQPPQEASPALMLGVTNGFDSDAAMDYINSVDLKSTAASQSTELKEDCGITAISNDTEDDKEELLEHFVPVIEYLDPGDGNETAQSHCTEARVRTRKASDYIRREAALRVKSLEAKNKKEQEILKLKLEIQENDRKRSELLLQAARAERDTKVKEEKRAEFLLEAAKLELELQKKRLGQFLPQLSFNEIT